MLQYNVAIYGVQRPVPGELQPWDVIFLKVSYEELFLRKTGDCLDSILSNTPAVFYSYRMVDGKKAIDYVSSNVTALLGFKPRELIENPALWIDCIHDEDRELMRAVPEKLEKESAVHVEYRINCRGGISRRLHEKQNLVDGKEGEKAVIALVWDVTESKQAERLIQARVNLLASSRSNTVKEMLQRALDEVCDIVGSPLGFYHFVSADEKKLTLKAWSRDTLKRFCKTKGRKRIYFRVDEAGLWADCLRERRPVIYNDFHSVPDRNWMPRGHAVITRLLVVPVMRLGRIVAVLGVGNKEHDYTEQDVRIVSYFADVGWSIAEHKLMEEKIHYISYHDTLTGLHNRAFLGEGLQRIDIEEELPISVIMADLNGLKLVNDTYGHRTGDRMLKAVAEILKSSCRKKDIVARWGGDEFIILLPRTTGSRAEEICHLIRSKCSAAHIGGVPVSLAMGVAAKENSFEVLGDIVKDAEDLMYKQKLADSKSARSAVVSTLLRTLGAKSYETEEHSCRMQMMALEFGAELGLSDSELNRLSLLITLHDIGKISIPEEVLTKKEPLTEKEWEIIKKHPETGFRITRSTEEFAYIAEEIYSHHERWDGMGYPRRLKGEQIPFLARVTAIVDAFEVMTNGRPYKKRLSRSEAVAEIKKCSGTQFDPVLAKLFLEKVAARES